VGRLFAPSARVGAAYFPQGIDSVPPPPLFLAYRLTPADLEEAVSGLSRRLNRLSGCQIADLVEVVGAQVPAVVVPGGQLPVGVLWRVNRRPEAGNYQMLAHLTDRNWVGVAGADTLGYPPSDWRPSDVVWSRFNLRILAGTPPGLYLVQTGLYDLETGQRLPARGGEPATRVCPLCGQPAEDGDGRGPCA
jgi:hypothetical protein